MTTEHADTPILMMTDTPIPQTQRVRVLRLIEYSGEREWVEDQVRKSIHGRVDLPRGTITAVTLQEFPEVLENAPVVRVEELGTSRFADELWTTTTCPDRSACDPPVSTYDPLPYPDPQDGPYIVPITDQFR